MTTIEQYKQIFGNDYCGFDVFFEKVLSPLFGDKIERKNEDLLASGQYREKAERLKIKKMTFVAQVEAFNTINVIDITVDNSCNLERSRVYIKELVRQILDNYAQAFIIFHYAEAESKPWRFSYIYKEGKQTDVTPAKRFTYVFGRNYSGRTAAERFTTLQDKAMDSAKDFKEAFSVESLSDEFFYNYRAIYANFVQYITGKRIVKKGGKWEEVIIHEPNETLYDAFDRNDKRIRDYVKKTLGRLTFLSFVERKGWLNNNRSFMRQLFDDSMYQDDYLDCVLEPLFYTILNTAPENRLSVFSQHNENLDRENEVEWDVNLLDKWKDLPFLNGGLFERDDDDKVRTKFPAIFFSNPNGVENYAGKESDRIPGRDYDWEQVPGLLNFFEQYNFTIDENDPNDAEVGVDPEMLGRIFENLLEDNKDKGAFYTPKEIVQYMCRESLIAYLQTDATDDAHRERLRRFVETHDATILHDAEYVREKIENVKICDPAIGSGAFPMGILNELVACRVALGLHIDKNVNRAEIKKHIIQNSIYGVDIEKGAVDIARLRFWLSIAVDEDEPQVLPNLDYKIMQGNSLLEQYEGFDLSGLTQKKTDENGMLSLFDNMLDVHRRQLRMLLSEYYDTADHKLKKQLHSKIQENVVKQLKEQGMTADLSNIDIAANTQFFLWHTWFNDVFSRPSKEGFDIVIGNPPYGAKYDNLTKKYYQNNYVTAKSIKGIQKGSLDTYTLFIELGYNLLRRDGSFAYIVPISLTSSDSLTGVHRILMKKCDTVHISSYSVRPKPVFENAVVNTSILLFKKTETPCQHLYSTKMHRRGNEFDLQKLIDNLQFIDVKGQTLYGRIPKIGSEMEKDILTIIFNNTPIKTFYDEKGTPIYYRTTGGRYYKVVTNYPTGSTKEKPLYFKKRLTNAIGCILSSSLAFWFYQIYSNNLDWKTYEIENFTIPNLSTDDIGYLDELYSRYLTDIEANANVRTTSGESTYNVDSFKEYKIVYSKAIIDEIDEYICPLYGLTKEETDFIKNYELEFRLAGE